MESVINNFINGNLSDARAGAKKYSANKLRTFIIDNYGYPKELAEAAALYLKYFITFNRYCEIEARNKPLFSA